MNIQAKQTGKTANGNFYSIIQDQPTHEGVRFHITVSKNDRGIYDCIHNPPNVDAINQLITELETELLSVNLTP